MKLVCISGSGRRRSTAHILCVPKKPHLVVTAPPELNSQAPLANVALARLRTGRAWARTLQHLSLLLAAFLRVMAAHVSPSPKLVAAIVE